MTIAWHVDDAITSHEDKKVLDKLGIQMKTDFGEMAITTGTEHSFLGMNVKIDKNQKTVKIEMKDQISKLIEEFEKNSGESVKSNVTTPSTYNLFKVDIASVELEKKHSENFQSTTASLLYIMKRARPDIETGVSFQMRIV